MESLIAPVLIISAAFNFFLGALMFLQGYRGVFNFAIAGVALWDISILFFYLDFMKWLNWVAPAHFFALLLAVSFYLFALRFPREIGIKINKIFLRFVPIFLFFCMTGLIALTNLIVGDVNYEVHSYFIGKFYLLYSLLLGAYLIGGSAILLQQYRDSSLVLEKQQIRFILIGALISIIVSTATDLLLPYIGIYSYIWVGPFSTITLVVAVSVAILKYHLFNIKLIIVELAILLLNLFLFLNVFTSHERADLILNVSVSLVILSFSIFLIRGIYKDIRDRERILGLVKEMEIANEKLRMLEGQKTEFVSIASHQLRTPLTVIKGYASMILEGTFGHINDSAREAMEKLYKSSEKIVALVEDLLTVSRIEQGRMMLVFEKVNFKELVQSVIDDLESEINESKIDLTLTAEEGKEFFVSVDEKKFKQVVKHILENAIKYTPANGSVRVAVAEDNLMKKIRLTVSDTGIGMTPEQITAIFERFNLKAKVEEKIYGEPVDIQAEKAEEEAESKMMEKRTPGIGLYIVQEIIVAHHGTIRIESAGLDRGATVMVELPKAEAGA